MVVKMRKKGDKGNHHHKILQNAARTEKKKQEIGKQR